jgi:hypothetical protein
MGRFAGLLSTDVYGVGLEELRVGKLTLSALQSVASDADGILDGQASSATLVTTVTTFLKQPPYPRNITILPAGTTTDVKAMSITVNGTNFADEAITEDFAFLANATDATVGVKAFKSVTSVVIPAQDGAGATFDIGWGEKLGLPFMADENRVLRALDDGVVETTAPAVVFDADEIEKNTIDLHSAMDGSVIEIIVLL